MRNRCAVFDCFDVQSGRLQCGNRAFAATTWSFDTNVNVPDSELDCFFCSLLGRHLARKRSAFSTAFESTGPSTGPTERFTLGVRDGYRRVIKSRVECVPHPW